MTRTQLPVGNLGLTRSACLTVLMGNADYGFEYSDEDVQEEDVDIENQYYNSKGAPSMELGVPEYITPPEKYRSLVRFSACIKSFVM